METKISNELRAKVINIATRLLTTECCYKHTNRSGWIMGFGNGNIAYIEDHRNKLEIETAHFSDNYDFLTKELFSLIFSFWVYTSDETKEKLKVEECKDYDMPENILIKLAKSKLYYGYKNSPIEFNIDGMNEAIDIICDSAIEHHKEFFNIK